MPIANTPADIGSAIAAARKARKLSQAKLAEMVRTSQAIISHVERGKTTAQLGIVLRIIAAVGLNVDLVEAGGKTTTPRALPDHPNNVVFDEPLPDESIDLDALVSAAKTKSPP